MATGLLQIGFYSIVGIPMYRAMVGAFEDAKPLLDGVMVNYKAWQAAANSSAGSSCASSP